ncbi:MAG: iron ABC transporter permease, partial [Verrucomicrobiales bacterium]
VCMRDWVASIILLPPGVQTIGSFIFNQFDQGEISAAMAMAACTVVLSTIVLVVVQAKKK